MLWLYGVYSMSYVMLISVLENGGKKNCMVVSDSSSFHLVAFYFEHTLLQRYISTQNASYIHCHSLSWVNSNLYLAFYTV